MFGLAHEICGEGGLGWARRLQLVHAGLQKNGGFSERVSQYLGRKYGYSPDVGAAAGARVTALLRMLAARLRRSAGGSRYYLGDSLDGRGHLQRDLHGPVQAAAARAVRDGRRQPRSLRDARSGDRCGARSDPARGTAT